MIHVLIIAVIDGVPRQEQVSLQLCLDLYTFPYEEFF